MCRHGNCPISEGRCITEKPGWEWAEKFGLPDASATQRRFLVEQSARWNVVAVKDGEPAPNPRGAAIAARTPPPLAKQAAGFATALAKHAASGFALAGEDEHGRRLAICQSCPSFSPRDSRCMECGCYMETKASWESAACPLGKW